MDEKYYSAPSNDVAALKKIKKVAVVRFSVNLYAKKKTGGLLSTGNPLIEVATSIIKASKEKEAIKPEELKALTDEMYDDFMKAMKNSGLDVIPNEQVLADENYKKFETGAKDGQVSGMWALSYGWKASDKI